MKKAIWLVPFLITGLTACKVKKKEASAVEKIVLPQLVVRPGNHNRLMNQAVYQPMRDRVVDLLHTELHLSFDYQRQHVPSWAVLTLRPYVDPITKFELDAHGFLIQRVAVLHGTDTSDLKYSYNDVKLSITCNKIWNIGDTLKLFIRYTARPNEIKNEGGRAITDSKGLYFINPLGTDPNKPRQIWTQGETEYNSGWFPTIDAPNEKHTQDIFLTVDTSDVTLSNGLLLESKLRFGGKREDHWQQLKPHAPYLTMIAIGKFSITRDRWRGKEVSYYLEPEFAPFAQTIFGKTTDMLEVFSQRTGVEYPWDKFSQIVCRDFVSGAMENTSAVLHNEMVQHTPREHLDNPREDIVAHELFHHWFGDLVTCRSWSNISLNESFATYGEYLYNEAAYDKLTADADFSRNFEAYLRNKSKYSVSLFRGQYHNPDDVFDVVSYQKGSWILHHLRATIGDEAFFNGLRKYLTDNAYQTTDIHHLRHALEITSGKDLRLFFQQWFEGIGHPELDAEVKWDATNKVPKLIIKQTQDTAFGMFQLRTKVAVLTTDGSLERKELFITKNQEEFELSAMGSEIKSWWLDPEGTLPAVIKEQKSPDQWLTQLRFAIEKKQYQPARRAAKAITQLKFSSQSALQINTAGMLLQSGSESMQQLSFFMLESMDTLYAYLEPLLVNAALFSNFPGIRGNAYYYVGNKGVGTKALDVMKQGLMDSSYAVMSTCLQALANQYPDLALEYCKQFESLPAGQLQRNIAWIYANHSMENKNPYFGKVLGKFGFNRVSILNAFGNYLKNQDAIVLEEGLKILRNYYELNSDRNKANQMLHLLQQLASKSKQKQVFQLDSYLEFKSLVESDQKTTR